MLYCGVAKAVERDYETFDFDTWTDISVMKEEDAIKTVNRIIKAPRVIILVRYEGANLL